MAESLRKTIRRIPGYDPVATAGDCVFDRKAAQLAVDFFPECLHHVKGSQFAGKPFVLGPWERAIIANTFGWKRPDGTRRYRKVVMFVPRKNGKTTLAAGIILYVLFCDGEAGAEIYSAAADRAQATLVFDPAVGMVRQEPMLRSRATVYKRSIVLNDHSGSYKPISADAYTKYGYNTHCVVVDELHAHRNRDLLDTLETSMGSRLQPLEVIITTRDYARESICNEEYDYACKVRDGGIKNPAYLPVLYGAVPEDDWTSPRTWKKANPNLGVSLDMDYLRAACQKAQDSPAFENTFKRLHLNLCTEQSERWLAMAHWDACAGDVDPAALKGRPCWAGLDLASTDDLTALVLYFPEDGHAVLPFFWAPKDNAHQRELRDRVPYETWARQGLMELTPGNVTDYRYVRKRIRELGQTYSIQEIAYDPWNATETALALQEEDGFQMIEMRQGWKSMNEPLKKLHSLILAGDLRHGGHLVLQWNAGNMAIKTDESDNIRPDKKRSSEKIDGMVALTMAIARAVFGKKGTSVYEERGLIRV